jgi:cellulose synthase operon protein C
VELIDPRDSEISLDQIRAVLEIYETGHYVRAWRASEAWGPFSQWRGVKAQILAGRLASNLGAMRQGNWLMRCAWLSDPADAEACYYYGFKRWRTQGPYPAWKWMRQRQPLTADTPAEIRSSWYTLYGGVTGSLRDFDAAEQWMRQAEQADPENPWVQVSWSQLLEWEDRYDEALQAARRSLERRPRFRPGLQAAAHMLSLLNRDDEAIELLRTAAPHLESNAIFIQLYQLHIELQQFQQAHESLERAAAFSPLAEKDLQQWFAAQRSEIAYRLGDFQASVQHARQSDNEFFKTIADRLEDPARADAPVTLLPVPFVRQHYVTCVPATLAAISRYWSMPADHLQVADEICYNGTSAYSERKWAREHGWVARDFTVTEPAAAALLERGIPFTFATVEPGSAHVQAIIGYDGRRGTLIVRDPYWRNANEGLADKVLERYRAFGPRGMALVPEAQQHRLDEVDLPDAAIWDQLHALDDRLIHHRRDQAQAIYAQLQAAAPDHLLTREARRRLAIYDQNSAEQLAAVEGLLEIDPDNPSLQLERMSCLRDVGHREDRLGIYRDLCGRKETHPIFHQQYAQELRADARRHDDAVWMLRRAIRRWPTHAANYYVLANLYWDRRRFEEASELYRIAACMDDKDEQLAHGYFSASVCRHQTDTALEFLRRRFERFGQKSSFPARTLYSAYSQLDRSHEALGVVETALQWRPDDGELRLFAADAYAASSSEHLDRSGQLLQDARDKSPSGAWLRTAARLAVCEGRLTDALEHWTQVLRTQPLSIDAHRSVAQLLAETQGRPAALEHLHQAAAQFPHFYPLQELQIEWLRDEPPEVIEAAIHRALTAHADDAWLHRELAMVLAAQRRFGEAWEQIDLAGQLDPQNSSFFLVRAHVLRCQNRIDQAISDLRRVVEMAVDNDLAISEWIELCPTIAQRREVLEFVRDQLVQQVIFGDGLLAFHLHARDALEPEEVLKLLAEAWQTRPDLWHAWSALIAQHRDMDQIDAAWPLSCSATERFPLIPRVWLDHSELCHLRGDLAGELRALDTAYQINPDWGVAVRMLCDHHERCGDYQRSRQLLERAVARNPLEVVNHLRLAEVQWHLGDRESAWQRAEKVVQMEPGFDPAWDCLNVWSDELQRPQRALEVARELTERRGGEARSWYILARMLDDPQESDERLQALDRAIELNPRHLDAWDLRAITLAARERWDEALAACQPPAWQPVAPLPLRARGAWLEAQRGDLEAAIARMQDIVREEPYYYEAWTQLSEWHLHVGDFNAAVEAAEAMVRIQPHREISFGYLGDARLAADHRGGAIQAFERALELNPAYAYAGLHLFDLRFEDEDWDRAEQVLGMLHQHADGPMLFARDVQLAAKRGDQPAARSAMQQICEACNDSSAPLDDAVRAMSDAGWQSDARQIMDQVIRDGAASENVFRYWGQLVGRQRDAQSIGRLEELASLSLEGRHATHGYVDGLFDAQDPDAALDFVRDQAHWLRQWTFTWGVGGYVLTRLRRYEDGADWHADWRDRPDAEPWMLVNVIESLRAVRREAEAVEVSHHALDMPWAYGQHLHHLWLASDAVTSGDVATAKEHWMEVPPEILDEDYQFDWLMVTAVIEMAEAEPHEKQRVFAEVRERVADARAGFAAYHREPARQRMYRRCLGRIAQYQGTWPARLWQLARWLRS